jgi:CubicO group peptidase (beta-lactamase class C family)
MLRNFLKIIVFLISTSVLFFSCKTSQQPQGAFEYVYQVPEQTSDGWETASLTESGISQDYLVRLMNRLGNHQGHLIHSIVIARYGKLVFDEYFAGYTHPTIGSNPINYTRETVHVLSSATKSYTSALLGIAISHGFIQDVNQKVFDFFPELASLNIGQKSDMTIEHMITMSPGLHWDQITYPILDERNDIALMQRAADPWEMYLSRPLDTVPGEAFLYSEGSLNVVGEIIKRASGIRLDQFAEQYLFTPLGINQHWWYLVKPSIGFIWASGDLRQRPRDMAKFGQLYLQEGLWQGEQLIPTEWVEAAARQHFTFTPPFWSLEWGMVGYSYAWWPKSSDYGPGAFAASGWGGQDIIVLPAFDLVAVFTGGAYYQNALLNSHDIMVQYILPALN